MNIISFYIFVHFVLLIISDVYKKLVKPMRREIKLEINRVIRIITIIVSVTVKQ